MAGSSRVGASFDVWYPGEAGGEAIADVLFGDVNPAGRLPITFPVEEGQLPLSYNHKPTGRGDDYVDLTGQPLFPFGFGLSYTTFEYSDLAIEPRDRARWLSHDSLHGQEHRRTRRRRSGAALHPGRPRHRSRVPSSNSKALRGFVSNLVRAAPSPSRSVLEDLRMLDAAMKWVVEPGVFRVLVGASSKDIRLRGELTVRAPGAVSFPVR